jgi:hypothetical protein
MKNPAGNQPVRLRTYDILKTRNPATKFKNKSGTKEAKQQVATNCSLRCEARRQMRDTKAARGQKSTRRNGRAYNRLGHNPLHFGGRHGAELVRIKRGLF